MSDAVERKQGKKIIFTEFSNNITLITIGVLSLAYLNQLTYYSFFSIPIYNYIQVSELITLFVPSLFDYLFQGLLPITIAYFLLRAATYTEANKVEAANKLSKTNEYEIISIINSIRGIKNLFTKELIQGSSFLGTIINFFQSIFQTIIIIISNIRKILILFFFIALVFYIYTIFDDDKVLYSKDHSKEFFNGAGVQAIMCAAGVVIIADELNTYIFKISNRVFRKISRQILFLLSPIFFVIIINKVMTDNIKKGLAIYDVEFKYDTSRIKTDTNIVYVGATQNYLFLRERITRKNYIYKIDKIDSLSIKKISYELGWIPWRK